MELVPLKGISMNPLLREGDLVLIEKIENEVQEGDILLFKDSISGEFISHRVIQRNPLLTKGDWAIQSDLVKREEVFARVVGFSRNDKLYHFRKGALFKLYCLISKNLTSPIKILRQFLRVLLIMISPFLFFRAA